MAASYYELSALLWSYWQYPPVRAGGRRRGEVRTLEAKWAETRDYGGAVEIGQSQICDKVNASVMHAGRAIALWSESNGTYFKSNVGRVSVVCVTRQAYATNLYRGQVAHTAGSAQKTCLTRPTWVMKTPE